MSTSRKTIALFLLLLSGAWAGGAVTGTLGTQSTDGFGNIALGYSVGVYGKFDEQTLLGFEAGQGTGAGASSIPLMAAALIRIPLGRTLLPLVKGEFGYALADTASGFLWRLGGGLDIKNGRRSSLLVLGGYERSYAQANPGGWYSRFGILLEW